MADHLTSDQRGSLMSRIGPKDSKPELIVRRIVHRLGYRFRLHRRDLPGTPDLVFPSRRKIIFVHGCWWHRHDGCSKAKPPKSNVAFWNAKFDRNVERDASTKAALEKAGWSVLTVWECETREVEQLQKRLSSFLETGLPAVQSQGVDMASPRSSIAS